MCQGTEKFYYVITTHIYIQISHYVYRLPLPTMSSFSFTQVSKKMRHWVQKILLCRHQGYKVLFALFYDCH